MKNYQEIIKEICDELNINLTLLSKDFIFELERDNIRKYLFGYKFPMNDHGIGLVLDDKYAFYEVLNNLNLKTVEVKPVFENYNPDNLVEYLNEHKELIVKSKNGTCGTEVFKVDNPVDLFDKVDFLLNKNTPICLSPYYNIKSEYRVIILNNEVKLMYGKKRPILIGDGKKTILELLQEFNPNYYRKQNNLDNLEMNLNRVLDINQKLEIGFKFNLSRGSVIFDINDLNLESKLQSMALVVTSKLNIKFASVDIIETFDNELLILEANSGVMMDNFMKLNKNGREIAKSIYKEAILNMFDN